MSELPGRPRNVGRRRFLEAAGTLGAAALLGVRSEGAGVSDTYTLPIANGERPVVKYPQKRPLIRLSTRPPQLETPWEVFRESRSRSGKRRSRR